MPSEGLLHTYGGSIAIAVVLLIIGAFACIVLTLTLMVRKAPPLTTQKDATTGMLHHGLGRWALLFAAITMGPQILFIGIRSLVHLIAWFVTDASPFAWVGALVVGGGLITLGALWVLQKRGPQPVAYEEPPVILPAPVQAEPMWGLPEGTPHWERPDFQ